MLEINLHNCKYEKDIIIKDAEFVCNNNGINCLIGVNGSGKTTLLNAISGFIPNLINGSFEGFVNFNNNKIEYKNLDYVFQNSESSLFFNKVSDQLYNLNKSETMLWLERFNLIDRLGCYIKELSIGQKKIICCLAALLSEKPICILDEPTTNLDNKNKQTLIELIKMKSYQKIVLIVSHDTSIIDISENVFLLNEKIVSKQIFFQAKTVKSLKPASDSSNTIALINLSGGFEFKYSNGYIYKTFSDIIINEGEITAFLGKNGAGKTTFANFIIKNYKKFYKKKISTKKISCGIMFQTFYKQIFEFSVGKELLFGVNKKKVDVDVDLLLKKINLYDKKNEDPRFLSDGQKRILLVVSLILKSFDLIILDEPFDNMDNKYKNILKEILVEFKKKGKSVIILDQDSADFDDIVDRYVLLGE